MTRTPTMHMLARALAALAFLLFAGGVHAAAPIVKKQAPGYYRMMLGEFEVTALSDGTVSIPWGKLLTNTTEARVNAAFGRSFFSDPIETSVNAYLVNTGAKLVLIDAGAGRLYVRRSACSPTT